MVNLIIIIIIIVNLVLFLFLKSCIVLEQHFLSFIAYKNIIPISIAHFQKLNSVQRHSLPNNDTGNNFLKNAREKVCNLQFALAIDFYISALRKLKLLTKLFKISKSSPNILWQKNSDGAFAYSLTLQSVMTRSCQDRPHCLTALQTEELGKKRGQKSLHICTLLRTEWVKESRFAGHMGRQGQHVECRMESECDQCCSYRKVHSLNERNKNPVYFSNINLLVE